MASLNDLIFSLPKGIDYMITERGANLSGGQRQRIALARAFYHNREFLVMDEATSALDSGTEREIVKEIIQLKNEITIVIVAHRMSTIKNCDVIIELDEGKIARQGSPEEIFDN